VSSDLKTVVKDLTRLVKWQEEEKNLRICRRV